MAIRLEVVLGAVTSPLKDEVMRFWAEHRALPPELAVQRAEELLVVARDERGALAGVSTSTPRFIEQLGFPCFYYRSFIGPAHRRGGLARSMIVAGHRALNARFVAGERPEILGVFIEVANAEFAAARNLAVWCNEGMNAVFIGKSPEGRHRRIWYFDGARIA
jgi:hypothetical protein